MPFVVNFSNYLLELVDLTWCYGKEKILSAIPVRCKVRAEIIIPQNLRHHLEIILDDLRIFKDGVLKPQCVNT
jgi:hypothetical protein